MWRVFTVLLFFLLSPLQILAGVGDTDNRYYVTDEMWAQEPYKKFVHLISGFDFTELGKNILAQPGVSSIGEEGSIGSCTAQYISPNLILSAGHCILTMNNYVDTLSIYLETSTNFGKIYAERYFKRVYKAKNYKNELFDLKLIDTVYDGSVVKTGDWAVWLVTDPKYYSDSYFDIKVPTKTTDVINAGWGFARIIKDTEISVFREIISNLKQSPDQKNKSISELSSQINEICEEKGIEPISQTETTLKASNCKMLFKDCSDIALNIIYREDEHKKTDRLSKKFEKICNNQRFLMKHEDYPYMLATTCDTWQGNSGGGYISSDGKYLYGIVSGGNSRFDNDNTNYATSSKQFDEKIKEMIKKYDSKNPVEENIAKIPTNLYGDEYIQKIKKEEKDKQDYIKASYATTEQLEQILKNILSNSEEITYDNILQFIDVIAAYQTKQKYENAKAREQSLANRTLTSASIAATGLGAMELARGLSEQKADKAAEQDMDAYIQTMRCTYGNGTQVKAGPERIELPGGNNPELMKLRAEYFALAASLKERKAALGLPPGIESEVILDKSQIGLYDDENVGITGGSYESLYRAKALGSESDQTKINEQQSASKKRVVGGGVATGVGTVGGTVGNIIINGDSNENKTKE